ncbi:MAG: tRNA (adenosine(37)-N6)-threonylcarbamoyltransferase complex dimerization subunit type 1 TsaB [Clostridiaceae bacterium]|jgi:tRNA threonylcarbamoyladenosine biosynthesis protein TsaB|nr:tRNA (adenosine(37)-N6)-threonylcarbamoyltransferase complex dimerization subunit type 1 TsaB [Clostridiaceae bacterium]
MLILALDTAWRTASAALCQNGKILAYRERDSEMNHSKTILPTAEELLAQQGISLDQTDLFAATAGPGSFTGLRIGVAAIKGYAWALDKPCAAISSLESAAWAAREHEGLLCAAVLARADEFFYAFFENREGRIRRLTEDRADRAQKIAEEIRRRGEIPWLTGTGAEGLLEYCNGLETQVWLAQGCRQNAAAAALCAWQGAQEGRLIDCHELKPSYLRLSQAERMKQNNQDIERKAGK